MSAGPKIDIAAEKILHIAGFSITNSLLMSWLVAAVLIVMALVLSKRFNLVPSYLQNALEILVEKFIGLMESIMGSRDKAEKYAPLVATFFLFILISNWLGVFPGVGSIGIFEEHEGQRIFVPLFRSPASDLNFTLILAIVAVLSVNILGARAIGIGRHLSKFFSFKGPIDFFVGILEFISEFARMISFAFRLFGNVFAGEVLLIIMAFLAPIGAPIPFLMLEFFVGFIQALVFTMLTVVFLSIATSHQH